MDSAVAVPSSVFHAMEAAVAELEGSHHEASLAAARELEGWRPVGRHFILAVLGTARRGSDRAWRDGLGAGLAAADREGAGSFLETSSVSNLAFYSTFGFEVIGHMCIGGGGPDVWAMFRKPLQQRLGLLPPNGDPGAPGEGGAGAQTSTTVIDGSSARRSSASEVTTGWRARWANHDVSIGDGCPSAGCQQPTDVRGVHSVEHNHVRILLTDQSRKSGLPLGLAYCLGKRRCRDGYPGAGLLRTGEQHQ